MDLVRKQKKQIEELFEQKKTWTNRKNEFERLKSDLATEKDRSANLACLLREAQARGDKTEISSSDYRKLYVELQKIHEEVDHGYKEAMKMIETKNHLIDVMRRLALNREAEFKILEKKIDEKLLLKTQRRLQERSDELDATRKQLNESNSHRVALEAKLAYYDKNEKLTSSEKT